MHIAALILTVNMLQNIIIPTPYPRYFLSAALAISFLTAPVILQLSAVAKNYFVAALFVFNLLNITVSVYILPNAPYLRQIKILDKKDAMVYMPVLNIYTAHYPYYWFFPALEALDDRLFGHPFDVNAYIINNINYVSIIPDTDLRPSVHDNTPMEENNQNAMTELFNKHHIDIRLLDKYFNLIDDSDSDIYQRIQNK